MSNEHSRSDSLAEEQASLWAARLDGGSLTPAQRKELDAWLAASPTHRPLLSEFCQLNADLEDEIPALIGSSTVPVPADISPTRNDRRRFLVWVGSIGLAAAAAVAVWVLPSAPRAAETNVATAVGERRTLTLEDGSRVDLNARTALVVELAEDERRVRLASGEAFFEVAKDAGRPFVVETPAGSVRVTGTAFNVRSDRPASLDVTVLEGSVVLRSATGNQQTGPISLAAGDRCTADERGIARSTLSKGELENILAWRAGYIVFDGVPLSQALSHFAQYHGKGITASPGAANLRLGGRFSLDDLEGFFTALEEVLPVRVSRDLSGTVLVDIRSVSTAAPQP
jgi:transmembrane sensor